MNVNSLNSMTFMGKIAQTKNGNEYEKSNEGKKYVPVIGAAAIGTATLVSKNYRKLLSASQFPGGGAGILLYTLGIMLGIGAIVDGAINKTRRKDSDKFAQTGEVSPKTNKGKINMGLIGLGIEGLTMGMIAYGLKSLKKLDKYVSNTAEFQNISKMMSLKKFAPIALMGVIEYFLFGSIYDKAVNKSREKLAVERE